MGKFHIPIEKPEEIIPRLGKGHLHWKKGRSAYELSSLWIGSGGIPASVRNVIGQAPEWRGAELLEGIFERETTIPGKGRPSQTDLLALVALADGNGVICVEGKVDESFGPLAGDWLKTPENSNRSDRLKGLCATLEMDFTAVGKFYYQLFHRTCSAIYEAQRFGYCRALMLVHSFDSSKSKDGMPAWFKEFREFSVAAGMAVEKPGAISHSKLCEGIEVRLAWVSDPPSL